MKNFDGYSRMIQGTYDNKLLTINVETSLSNEKERQEIVEYMEREINEFENYNINMTKFKIGEYNIPDEAFMRKLFIKWGNETLIIDMVNLQVISSNSSFPITYCDFYNSFTDLKEIKHYTDKSVDNMIVSVGKLNIVVSNYSNPQVRTGFHIENVNLLNNSVGAIVKPMYSNKFIINTLGSTKKLKNIKDKFVAKYRIDEYYIDNDNNEKIMTIDVL